MANSVEPSTNHSIRPRLLELINVMTEDQCQKLFANMQQAMGAQDKREPARRAFSFETSEERRSVPRIDSRCPVYIEGVTGQQTITNLSIGGAFVECDTRCRTKFSVGQVIRLTIKFSNEDDLIRVQAQIVNFSDRGMHCQFAHLDRRTADAIRHWLTA